MDASKTAVSTELPTWSPADARDPELERNVDGPDADHEPEPEAGHALLAKPPISAGTSNASSPALEIEPVEMEPVQSLPFVTKPRKQSTAVARLLALGTFVLVAGLAFAVGRMTVGSAGTGTTNGTGQFAGAFGPNASGGPAAFRNGTGGGALTISGTVESVNNGTITVKLANGSSVTVDTSSSTTYHGQQNASQSDVTAGKTITVTVSGGAAPGASASAATTRTASDVTIAN